MIAAKNKDANKAEAPSSRPAAQPADAAEKPFNPVWGRLAMRVQAKLAVSAPDDPYEREADRVADQVMRMPASVQRTCSACAH